MRDPTHGRKISVTWPRTDGRSRPLRLCFACKWIQDIELTTFDAYDPYWVKHARARKTPIKTKSRLDTPKPFAKAGIVMMSGFAWAQRRGIERVEVLRCPEVSGQGPNRVSCQGSEEHAVAPPSKYTPEFREEAVQVALRSSKTISETAREMDLNPETLRGWVKRHRKRNEPPADAELSLSERAPEGARAPYPGS